MWLNISLCWKVTKVRTTLVLVSLLKHVWCSIPQNGCCVFTVRHKVLSLGQPFLRGSPFFPNIMVEGGPQRANPTFLSNGVPQEKVGVRPWLHERLTTLAPAWREWRLKWKHCNCHWFRWGINLARLCSTCSLRCAAPPPPPPPPALPPRRYRVCWVIKAKIRLRRCAKT